MLVLRVAVLTGLVVVSFTTAFSGVGCSSSTSCEETSTCTPAPTSEGGSDSPSSPAGADSGIDAHPDASVVTPPDGFTPAKLPLTSWFTGGYPNATWPGAASAGPSAEHSLIKGTGDLPTPGAQVGSYVPAVFTGNRFLLSNKTWDVLISPSSWSLVVLFNVENAAAGPPTNPYNVATFICDDNGSAALGIGFASGPTGVIVWQANGVDQYPSINIPTTTKQWHLAQAKFDGTTLKLRVDASPWSTATAMPIPLARLTNNHPRVGISFNNAFQLDGSILEILTSATAFTDSIFDDILRFERDRYNLPLN